MQLKGGDSPLCSAQSTPGTSFPLLGPVLCEEQQLKVCQELRVGGILVPFAWGADREACPLCKLEALGCEESNFQVYVANGTL